MASLRTLLRLLFSTEPGIDIVAEAENGAEAVRLAERHRPDVVFLDIAMPIMDGLQAAPLIRAALPQTKIVMLSGFSAASMREEALRCGADEYIEKGMPPGRIVEYMRRACAMRSSTTA